MGDLFATLFSYATLLSGLHSPVAPDVKFVPKEFFYHVACNDQPCPVMGWYPGTGNVVYVKDTLDLDNKINDSIIVHEMVHYLQAQNNMYAVRSCVNSIALERQAYGVQKQYLLQEGVIGNGVGLSVIAMHCEE